MKYRASTPRRMHAVSCPEKPLPCLRHHDTTRRHPARRGVAGWRISFSAPIRPTAIGAGVTAGNHRLSLSERRDTGWRACFTAPGLRRTTSGASGTPTRECGIDPCSRTYPPQPAKYRLPRPTYCSHQPKYRSAQARYRLPSAKYLVIPTPGAVLRPPDPVLRAAGAVLCALEAVRPAPHAVNFAPATVNRPPPSVNFASPPVNCTAAPVKHASPPVKRPLGAVAQPPATVHLTLEPIRPAPPLHTRPIPQANPYTAIPRRSSRGPPRETTNAKRRSIERHPGKNALRVRRFTRRAA